MAVRQYTTFHVEGQFFGVDVAHVQEVLRFGGCTPSTSSGPSSRSTPFVPEPGEGEMSQLRDQGRLPALSVNVKILVAIGVAAIVAASVGALSLNRMARLDGNVGALTDVSLP